MLLVTPVKAWSHSQVNENLTWFRPREHAIMIGAMKLPANSRGYKPRRGTTVNPVLLSYEQSGGSILSALLLIPLYPLFVNKTGLLWLLSS